MQRFNAVQYINKDNNKEISSKFYTFFGSISLIFTHEYVFSVLAGIIPLSLRNGGGHLIPFAPIVCKWGATSPDNATQENMSADVRGATCRIAIRVADDFTFTRVNFDCVTCNNNTFNCTNKFLTLICLFIIQLLWRCDLY